MAALLVLMLTISLADRDLMSNPVVAAELGARQRFILASQTDAPRSSAGGPAAHLGLPSAEGPSDDDEKSRKSNLSTGQHSSGSVARSGKLTRDRSTLMLDGRTFCGIGLNIVDLLWIREGADCCHQRNNSKALEDAAARGFPFVRFAASPYFANDYWSLRDWRNDPERYWSQGMDRVVALASALGGKTRLVPDLLWNPFAFADLCGEPLSALFNGSDTCTRRAAAEYVTQAARRYSARDEILFWELSNENNALVDGWFANSSAGCDPTGAKGTPLHRSDADNFDTAQMIATHAWLAQKIRAADPGRLINSGNSLPRPSAEHWRRTPREEVAHHRIDSRPDNKSEFVRNLLDTNAGMDFVSAHTGGSATTAGRPFCNALNGTSQPPTRLLELAKSTAATHSLPFYVGEFSVTVAPSSESAARSRAGRRSYEFAEAVVDWVVESCRRKQEHEHSDRGRADDDAFITKLEEANRLLSSN